MVNIDLTPQSGRIILFGNYLWEAHGLKEDIIQISSDFHIELIWDSDLMLGVRINRISWLDEVPEDKKVYFENEIQLAYKNLQKKPVILLN